MILGFSLGACHKFLESKNRDDYITLIRENFDVNAIEIILAKDSLKDFHLSQTNYNWLKGLDYISYHILHQNVFDDEIEVLKQLPRVDGVICHIDKILYVPDIFYRFKILYENTEYNYSFINIPNICFDVSHALSFNLQYLEKFYKEHQKCIKEIHLSNYTDRSHVPFYKDSKKFFEVQKIVDFKNYPVIIEVNFESFEEMKNEYNFLKEII